MTFGTRRIGKTSLLFHLERELKLTGSKVIYCDMRSWKDEIENHDVSWIEQKISSMILKECNVKDKFEFKNITGCLEGLFERLEENKTKVVLILDEFDLILSHAASKEWPASQDPWVGFLARLGAPPRNARDRFSLVIAGHQELGSQKDYLTRYLWYLKDLLPVELDFFSEDEAREYFIEKVSRKFIESNLEEIKNAIEVRHEKFGSAMFTKSVIPLIERLTGNHPYYLSLLCRELIQVMNSKFQSVVTNQDLREGIELAVKRDSHVSSLWWGDQTTPELFQDLHKTILEYLVQKVPYDQVSSVSDDFIHLSAKALKMDSSEFKKAIDQLTTFHILEKEKGADAYRFKIDLMRAILDKKVLS